MICLHLYAWGGGWYPQSEWPIRISTFGVFGAAVLMTPVELKSRMWQATLSATPKWILAIGALLWVYWLGSLLYFTMWYLPARGTSMWYQDFTGRFMAGWGLAALLFYGNARDHQARQRGPGKQSL